MAVAIFLYDLAAQFYYLRGPLFTANAAWAWSPWVGAGLGALCLGWRRAANPALTALALLHYVVTLKNGRLYTEGDAWLWLMVLAFLAIPAKDSPIESYWVGVLKLVGFCVYFFAGLHKIIVPDWRTGIALQNVFLDHDLINARYSFVAETPWMYFLSAWITLFQRLVVPWGLWSSRRELRLVSAGLLALMHYSYMVIMNLGTFSWVGILFLAPFFFDRGHGPNYCRWPKKTRPFDAALAGLAASALIFFPLIHWTKTFGLKTPESVAAISDSGAPGFLLHWGMFAITSLNRYQPVLIFQTCTGRRLVDDQIFWDFGESRDYFRRRALKNALGAQLLVQAQASELEKRVIENTRELVGTKRVVILQITHDAEKVFYDSGEQKVAECPSVLEPVKRAK